MKTTPTGVDAGLPRNYVRCCLALLVAEAPAHGYRLMESISQLGIRLPDPGFVYRSLRTMEDDRHVLSFWEESTSGPARRSYQLTEAGAAWLHQSASSLAGTHGCLSAYLHRHERLSATEHDTPDVLPSIDLTKETPSP